MLVIENLIYSLKFSFWNKNKNELKKYFLIINIIILKNLRNLLTTITHQNNVSDSFYVYYPKRVVSQVALWRKYLPFVEPYYAIKSNPVDKLISILYQHGVNFDCASKQELQIVHENLPCITSKKVIYANPCKSRTDLDYAKMLGSPLSVIDSKEEINKLKSIDYKGSALLRIAVDDSTSKMKFSMKFGLVAKERNIESIAEYARNSGIELLGTSFHVGSSCTDGIAYEKANELAVKTNKILRTFHHSAYIIDIGGGFLADSSDFKKKSVYIKNYTDFRYIAEPGRFFSNTFQDFFVRVIGKKPWKDGWRYTINDSLYGQFSNIPFDHALPIWYRIASDNSVRKRVKGVLFGRTCDSIDVIAKSDSMEELEEGDWLYFPNMGSYTNASATEFNGFPKPKLYESDIDIDTTTMIDYMPKDIKVVKPVSSAELLE